jgi:hypothetical protein
LNTVHQRGPILLVVVALVAAVSALVSCQSIAGIEDRVYQASGTGGQSGGDGGVGTAVSALCKQYCKTVMTACPERDDAKFGVYPSEDVCLAVCPHLDEGDATVKNPKGNTVACRLNQAKLADQSKEFSLYCPAAGPGGAGVCGTNCENYCDLYSKLCPSPIDDCVDKCPALTDKGTFDATIDHDGDTLQCRLVHVSNSAFDPATHCEHATFSPQAFCQADKVTCDHYCQLVMSACTDDLAVYESIDQCKSVCGALDLGKPADTTEDTVGCRTYHSYNAFSTSDPGTHCPHAGPGGDTHCGSGNCPAYCKIAADACPTEFAGAYVDSPGCLEACGKLTGALESKKTVATAEAGGDSVSCRMLNAARGYADPSACAAAVGTAAPCQ